MKEYPFESSCTTSLKIAVSACLLGEKIRYDGGDKLDRFITDELGLYAEYIPFCPEHLAFGTPRSSVRLVRENDSLRIRSNKDGSDLTEPLKLQSRQELLRLGGERLCGIIFKSKSPSCGMKSAKLYRENGVCEGKEDGIFAAMCRKHFPLLPMEEEGRLQDAWLRENFVMQLFAYDAYERFKASKPTPADLITFHASNKFMLQAKDEQLYRQLGHIVANGNGSTFKTLLERYESGFKTAISRKSSIKRNRNVLEHMAGFFKNNLTKSEKKTLHDHIHDYAEKIVPLIVPLSTIALFAQKYDTRYLLEQTFLSPYPKKLALRSHIDSGK